jgi:hypothetical protein
LESGATSCASSLSLIATPRPSSGHRLNAENPPPGGLARRLVRSYVRLWVWRQRPRIRRFRPFAAVVLLEERTLASSTGRPTRHHRRQLTESGRPPARASTVEW